MDIKELKAHAYDCLVQMEALQQEIKVTNQRIAEAIQAAQVKDDQPKDEAV